MMSERCILEVLHSLDYGGAEVLAVRLAQRFSTVYPVGLALIDSGGPLEGHLGRERIRTAVIGRRPGLDWACVLRLRRILMEWTPAVIIAHQYTPFFYSALARGLRKKVPVVYVEHGRFYPDKKKLRRFLFNRFLLRRHDVIVAVGKAVKHALVEKEGFPASRISVVYNGVDMRRFDGCAEKRNSYRDSLGATPRDVVVVHVARFDPLKDHLTALRAFRYLRDIPMKLILVGDGPTRSEIESTIRSLNLEDCVRILGYREDVPEVLAAGDIFLLTSLNEGIPVTIIEAMMVGLPVVATEVGGVPEIVAKDETGLLVSPGNPEETAKALRRLATDCELRTRLGHAGRQRAAALFSEDRMFAEYDAIVKRCISSST
ncbi:MAG: glycosyltransferase [Thermogutta sp.]|uniref:glycosyltransferase n=1 Tax=Thermogutta sp. TaxID=1962930 RepID=UPI0019C4536B|nr:glycosyltransferase [Thermogutta sp.]